MDMNSNLTFKRFGVLLDCSRNAVMNIESLKRFVDIISSFGYNELQLYTEDIYELEEYKAFGYGRGAYSKTEIRELDEYCKTKKIELVPCIETLAHLKQIFRHKEFSNLCDIDSVLNCTMDETYQLIETMIRNISQCFSSKKINLGMDEANLASHGVVFFKKGVIPKDKFMLDHLKKVKRITDKYGFESSVWYDQFAWAAYGDCFYTNSKVLHQDFIDNYPKDVNLIYWDYGGWLKDGTCEEEYIKRINTYKKITNNVHFAGSVERQGDYCTNPEYNNKVLKSQILACQKAKVDSFLVTIWGDDGAESPWFIGLPSLYYASTIAHGTPFNKEFFYKITGFDYDLVDTLSKINYIDDKNNIKYVRGFLKTILYDDVLQMNYVHSIDCSILNKIDSLLNKLKIYKYSQNYVYFDAFKILLNIIKTKIKYSQAVYSEYKSHKICSSIKYLLLMNRLLIRFERLYRKQWYFDNKSYGYEVFCIKIGGLIQRNKMACELLDSYDKGLISKIEELENNHKIDFNFGGNYKDLVTFNVF